MCQVTFACTKMGSVRCQNPLLGTYLSFLMLLADILKDNGLGERVTECVCPLLVILLPCSTKCGMLQDGEASRLYQRQRSKEQQPLMQEQETLDPDLLPRDLADSDSLFTAVGAVEVHHKISYPEVSICLEWRRAACHDIEKTVSVIRHWPSLPKVSVRPLSQCRRCASQGMGLYFCTHLREESFLSD